MNVEHIVRVGNQLFGEQPLHRWQDIAIEFYPEMATFTSPGVEYSHDSQLAASAPVLARRELGNAISAMLRPTAKPWFHIRTAEGWDDIGINARRWLEKVESTMQRLMYRKGAGFTKAAKRSDHDFITFGNAALQVSMSPGADGLLFRNWHLRDVAWGEDADGTINVVFRRWKARVADLVRTFPKSSHPETREKASKNPFDTVECWHVVAPADFFPGVENINTKYVSIYLELDHKHILEKVGAHELGYVIPRWQTLADTPYAISQATSVALADARQIQAMTGTLLEAGEKAVNPPMVAKREVFGGNFAIYAGGVTWADAADARLGDTFSELNTSKNGIPFGRDLIMDAHSTINMAFFRDKLNLPPTSGMTAYEVSQRVQEYIRNTLPLFEPIEHEYNAPLCDTVFSLLMRAGAFGSPFDMPEELHGRDVEFIFESPLRDATERVKVQSFGEAAELMQTAAALDPKSSFTVDVPAAFRDTMQSAGIPSDWLRTKEEAERLAAEAAEAELQAQMAAMQPPGAEVQ